MRRVCLIICALSLLPRWSVADAIGPALPSAPASVVLATPINATWAADHADYWQSRGVDGFVFRGILNNFSELPIKAESPEESELLRELRQAVRRLAAAGISKNFLHLEWGPDANYFTQRGGAQEVERAFQWAGRFCKQSGLRGIAIETRSSAFSLDLRWDGYPDTAEGAQQLKTAAAACAQRALRAYIREHPESDVLVLVDSVAQAPPLWLPLFGGFVSGVGAADTVKIDLAAASLSNAIDPEDLYAQFQRLDALVADALGGDLRSAWRRSGHIAGALAPFQVEAGVPVPGVSPGAFRVQACAAKLHAPRYVVVFAPSGGLWEVREEETPAYVHLAQSAPAQVVSTPALLDIIEPYAFHTPVDAYTRVARFPFLNTPGYVLQGRNGAAVVAWEGLEAPYALPDLAVPSVATDLTTGLYLTTPTRNGARVIDPVPNPILIDGLPETDWTLPAGVKLWLDAPLSPERRHARLHARFINNSREKIDATLELLTEPGYSLGAASFPFSLDPGESALFERTLRGVFPVGSQVILRALVLRSGVVLCERPFSFEILPDLVWSTRCDGVPSGTPAILEGAGESPLTLVSASTSGEVLCLDPEGEIAWHSQFKARFDAPATVGRDKAGEACLALADARGVVRILSRHGVVTWISDVGAPVLPEGIGFAPEPAGVGDALVVARLDHSVSAYAQSGDELWRIRTEGVPLLVRNVQRAHVYAPEFRSQIVEGLGRIVFIATGVPSPELIALDNTGSLVYSKALESIPTALTDVVVGDGSSGFRLVLGYASGDVEMLNAEDGARTAGIDEQGGGVRHLVFSGATSSSGRRITLAREEGGVFQYADNGKLLWSYAIPQVSGLTPYSSGGESYVLIATDSGELHCVGGDGGCLWRDMRSTWPISAAAVVEGVPEPRIVYASQDHFIRAVTHSTLRVEQAPPGEDARTGGEADALEALEGG